MRLVYTDGIVHTEYSWCMARLAAIILYCIIWPLPMPKIWRRGKVLLCKLNFTLVQQIIKGAQASFIPIPIILHLNVVKRRYFTFFRELEPHQWWQVYLMMMVVCVLSLLWPPLATTVQLYTGSGGCGLRQSDQCRETQCGNTAVTSWHLVTRVELWTFIF